MGIHHLGHRYFSRLDADKVFVVLAYPAFVTGLAICGGLHDHCDTVTGRALQLSVFVGGLVWYLAEWWVLLALDWATHSPATRPARWLCLAFDTERQRSRCQRSLELRQQSGGKE